MLACARVCVTEALYGGVLLTLLTVSFHMEINEEAPLIHCHIYSGMNRDCRVCRESTTKKSFLELLFYDRVHILQQGFQKNKHVIFRLQFVLVEILFPGHFLKGIGSKRIISFILTQIKKFTFTGVIKTIIQ